MNIQDIMRGLSGGTVNSPSVIGTPKHVYIGGKPIKVPDEDLEKYIADASTETGVPKSYIRAIIERENAEHIANVSWKGVPGANSTATGLGQFLDSTAKEVGIDSTDPAQSVKGTARYLKKHLDSTGGDFGKAAMRYIGGTDALGTTPDSYASDVLNYQKQYAQVYGETGTDMTGNPGTSSETPSAPVNRGIGSGSDIREQVRGILGGAQRPPVKPSMSVQDISNFLMGIETPEEQKPFDLMTPVEDTPAPSAPAPTEKPFTPQFSTPPAESTAAVVNQPQKPVETQIGQGKIPLEGRKGEGFGTGLARSAVSGIAKTTEMFYSIPAAAVGTYLGLTNLFNLGVNKAIGAVTGKKEKVIEDNYKIPSFLIDNPVINKLEQTSKEQGMGTGTYAGENALSLIGKKKYGDAGKYVAQWVIEQAPNTVGTAAMIGFGVPKMLTLAAIGAGTAGQSEVQSAPDVQSGKITQLQSTANADFQGLFEAAFEAGGEYKVLEKLTNAFKETASKVGKEQATKTFGDAIKKVALGFFEGARVETPQEMATQFTQDVTSKITGVNPDLDWKDILSNQVDVALGTVVMGGAPGAATSVVKQIKENAATKPIAAPIETPVTVEDIQKGIGQVPEDKLINNANNDEVWNYTVGGRKVDRISLETKATGLKAVDISKGREPLPDEHYADLAEQSSRNDVTGQKSLAHYNSYLDAVRKGGVEDETVQHFHLHGDEMAFGYAYKDETGKQRLIDIKADVNNFGAFNETEGFGHERTNDLNTDLQAKINEYLTRDKSISEAKTPKEKVLAAIKTIEGLKEDINNIRVLIPSTGKIVNLSTSFGIAENPKTSEEMLNSGKKKVGPNSIVVDDLLQKEYNISNIKGIDRTQEYVDAGLTSQKLKAYNEERQKRKAAESVLLQGQAGVEPGGSIRPGNSGSVEEGKSVEGTKPEVKVPEKPAEIPAPKIEEVKTPEKPIETPVVKKEEPQPEVKKEKFTGIDESGAYIEGVEDIDIRIPKVLKTTAKIRLVQKKNGKWTTGRSFNDARQFKYKNIDEVPNKDGKEYNTREEAIQAEVDNGIAFFKKNGNKEAAKLLRDYGEKQKPVVGKLGLHVINTPSGKFKYVGSVPNDIGYVDATPKQLEDAKFGGAFGPKVRLFDTEKEAIDFAESKGYKVAKKEESVSKQKPVEKVVEKEPKQPRYYVVKNVKEGSFEIKDSTKPESKSVVFGDETAAYERADFLNKQPEGMKETEITPTKAGLIGKDVTSKENEIAEQEKDFLHNIGQAIAGKFDYVKSMIENNPKENALLGLTDIVKKSVVETFSKDKNNIPKYAKFINSINLEKYSQKKAEEIYDSHIKEKSKESTNVLKKSTTESIIKEEGKTKEEKTAEARERFNKKQAVKPKEGEVSGKGKLEQPPADDVGAVDRGGAGVSEGAGKEGDAGKRTPGEGENLPPRGREDGGAGTTPARSPRTGPAKPVGGRRGKARGDLGRDTGAGLTESQKKRQELLKKLGKSITGEDLSAEIGVPQELTDEQKGIAFDLVASTITDENLKDFPAVAKDVKTLAGGYTQDPLFQKAIEDAYDAFAEDPDNGVSVRKVSFSDVLNPPKPKPKALINYLIENADNIGEGGPEQKTNDNIEAIRILKQIEAEERFATEEEQQKLVKYVGWGALSNVFNDKNKAYRQDLKDLLTDAEYADARGSTQNAHYTSPGIIQHIWKAVMRFGFNGGSVLEPGMGIGHFYGLRPNIKMAMEGIEMDSITGRIARQLYQGADIRVQPYETVKMPKDFYTLAISNVPFSKNAPVEPADVKTPGIEGKPSLHNFYFLKSLYGLKPGGVLAFVTSHWTMDSINNTEVRAQMMKSADFLGAIRLPETAFKKNAGTEVVTDIIFLQKRVEGQAPSPMNALFTAVQDVEYDAPKAGGKKIVQVSNYFINKPEMVMGEQNLQGTMRGFGDHYTVQYKGENLLGDILKAVEKLPENIMAKHIETNTDESENNLFKDMDVIQRMPLGSFFVRDGVTYQIDFETGKPKKAKGNIEVISRLAVLKEKVLSMYYNQRTNDNYDIKEPLAEVNKLYENFVKKYGPIAKNIKDFDGDSFESLLMSLENYDDQTGKATKSDLLKGVVFEKEHTIETTNSTQEAVIVSLNKFGALNIPHIAKMLGVEQQQAVDMLIADKLIFKDHVDFLNGGKLSYKTRDEYLSGNVREKFEGAKKAVLKDKSFGINASELEAVIPMDKTPEQITIRINSPILQTEDVKDFIGTIYYPRSGISVVHDSFSGKWNVDIRMPRWREDEYATSRMSGEKIINVLMASGRPQVYDTVENPDGSETKVLNEEESAKAQVKADEITKRFKEWLWTDEARTNRLVRRFNDEFNSTVNREYVHPSRVIDSEAKIRFPGSAFPYPARKHQADVVWRILQSINVMLAHEVGSGKTLEMIWAGMEAKRLGLIKKPVYVFPNHMVKQWTNDFLKAYPNARILVAKEGDLKPKNRRVFINRIATGNWDAVLIKREDFKSIPLSPKETTDQIQIMVDRYSDFIETLKNEDKDGNRVTIKQLEAQRDAFEARIQDLQNLSKKEQGTLYFEDLGIDMLFVDEADEYKNLNYYTSLKKVKGLGTQKGSGRALNLFFKTQYMNRKKQRIVFATGTPIANSLVESYSMMRYLQNDWLEEHGIESFDDWNRLFTETLTDLELDNTGTTYKPTTRFKKITNVPSFLKALREVWDIKNGDYLKEAGILIPGRDLPHHKIINVTAPATDLMKSFKRYLVRREKNLKGKKVTKGADNTLVIINDGQKAALDLRLFNPTLPDMPESKLNIMTNNILGIYKKYEKQKYTQLVFLDNARSYSKDPHGDRRVLFDATADITKKLIAGGVKPEEIVDFTNKKYDDDDKKASLFKDVREGKVRVLIGSVKKMGAGTNVQTLVKAIHQPEAKWNPRDFEQSNGRGIRQGNEVNDYDDNGNRINPEGEKGTVEIYNYATKGSLDTGIWGLLETKSKVIKTIMKADPDNLADEIEEEYFGSVKELSIEDPVMKEAMGLRHRVKELETLEKVHISSVSKAKSELKAIPGRIKEVEDRIKLFEKDIEKRALEKKGEDFSITIEGKTYDKRKDAGKALMDVIEKNEKKLDEEIKRGSVTPSKTGFIGEYAGFPIRVVSESGSVFSITEQKTKFVFVSRVEAVGKFNYIGSLNPETRNPEGMIQSLHHALYKSMDEKLQLEKDHILELEKSKAINQKQIDKPFAEAQELKEKKERKVVVEKILSEHKEPEIPVSEEPVSWETLRIVHDIDDSDKPDKGDVREGDEGEASMGIPEAKYFEPEQYDEPVTPEPKKMKAQDFFKPGEGKGKRLGYALASKKTGDHIVSEVSKKKDTTFLSGVEKFYSQWKSETFPIQKLAKMAEKESGLKLEDAERLDFAIEKVWGAAGATKALIDENLKPIYDAIKKNGGEIYDEANKYMVAKRTVDLYENEAKGYIDAGYDVETAKQMVDFVESGTHRFSEEIQRVAEGVWKFGQKLRDIRLEHGIIDDNLWALLDERYYVPFLRDHKDVESHGAQVYGGTKFTSTNKGIMRIKGSSTGAKIIDPIQSLIKQAYETVENAARVDVANKIIDLSEKYPGIGEMIKELPPKWIKAGTIEHRMEIDVVLRPQLEDMAEKLGVSVEYKGKLAGRMGGRMKKVMGMFKDDAIKLLAGSTEGTFAHELGHAINTKHEWLNNFVMKYDKEMNSVADSRFQGQEVPVSFVNYCRKPSEKIAEFISMYVTDRNTLKEIAPQAMSEFEDRISDDDVLKDLIEMAPSNASGIKSVEENNFILDRTVPTDEDVVSLLRNGKVKSYRMPIEVATAMKNLHPAQLPGWIKLLALPSQMVRAGAVGLNIDFFIPNVFRDQIDAAFNSNLIPFYDALGGLKSYLTKDKYYRQYLAEGGSMESAEAGTAGLKTSASQIQYGSNLGQFADLYYWKTQGILKGLTTAGYYVLKSPFAGLMELGKMSEMTTRLAIYRRALKKGLSVPKSVHSARQSSLEFNNIGSQMRTLNQLVPFTNVSFEGIDRMVRTFRDNPKSSALKVMIYMIGPLTALWFWNRDDDDYKLISVREKLNNWIIMKKDGKGGYHKIPKAHITKFVVNPIQMAVESQLGYVQKSGWQIAGEVLQNVNPADFGSMPPVIRMIWEPVANYDFYWHKMIESPTVKNIQIPGMRFTQKTNGLLKIIGKALNISPIMMQHELELLGAGFAKNVFWAADVLMGDLEKEKQVADFTPIARRFSGRVTDWNSDIDYAIRDIDKILQGMRKVSKKALSKNYGYNQKEMQELGRKQAEMRMKLLKKRYELVKAKQAIKTLSQNAE